MHSRIIIVGPISSDKNKKPVGEGGKLYYALLKENYQVFITSSIKGKIARAVDTMLSLFFRIFQYNVILLQVFGLKAIILEDIVTLFGSIFNKRVVLTIHGGAFPEWYSRFPRWNRRILKRASVINTPSNFIKDFLSEKGYKIDLAPNFIDLQRFPYKRNVQNPNSLLWVRAFHDIYHPELAIFALKEVQKIFSSATLTMIGPDQGTLDKCRALISELDLDSSVTITGPVPNEKLKDYYQTHQVYLNTTRYESFGVALIEAGACGIPCVSTNAGEIPFLWKDGENILLAERDPFDFAKKIKLLFENITLREKISLNAAKNAGVYSWGAVKDYWLKTIENNSK